MRNQQLTTNNLQQQAKKEAGFTIIEILVSAFVFSIIAIVVSGLFIQVLALERRSFASQKIQENGLFIMELMSREIRVSKIENQDSNCNAITLTIDHPVNGTITYSLVNGVLKRAVNNGVPTDLSSSTVTLSNLKFCIKGSAARTEQARVAILMSIQNKTGPEILTANLETAVTSRDVQLKF